MNRSWCLSRQTSAEFHLAVLAADFAQWNHLLIEDGLDRTFVADRLKQSNRFSLSVYRRVKSMKYFVTIETSHWRRAQHSETVGTKETLRRSVTVGVFFHVFESIDEFSSERKRKFCGTTITAFDLPDSLLFEMIDALSSFENFLDSFEFIVAQSLTLVLCERLVWSMSRIVGRSSRRTTRMKRPAGVQSGFERRTKKKLSGRIESVEKVLLSPQLQLTVGRTNEGAIPGVFHLETRASFRFSWFLLNLIVNWGTKERKSIVDDVRHVKKRTREENRCRRSPCVRGVVADREKEDSTTDDRCSTSSKRNEESSPRVDSFFEKRNSKKEKEKIRRAFQWETFNEQIELR